MIEAMSAPSHDSQASRLLADADLCVKCGLCLPHCPTYLQTQHEGDSPRGRITLVQGLLMQRIATSDSLERHLDGCLSCRRCEVVCPARVPYSRILDGGRAVLHDSGPPGSATMAALKRALLNRLARALMRAGLRLYRRSGTQALVRRFHLLGRGRIARLDSVLPSPPTAAVDSTVGRTEAIAGDTPAVALFEGCVTDVFERDALDAATTLLRAAGYRVNRPRSQTCCGALYQHSGQSERARTLARQNLAAFAGASRIATITSGCGASLRDYADLPDSEGIAFANRVREFSDWLLPNLDRLRFRPLAQRAALHLPCTALNVMQAALALRTLLSRIPNLDIVDLDPSQRCCGAAGTYFMTQPEMADRLLAPKLDAIVRLQPDLVISSNIGCTLHLLGGLNRSGQPAPALVHPAVLLARQLDQPPPRS